MVIVWQFDYNKEAKSLCYIRHILAIESLFLQCYKNINHVIFPVTLLGRVRCNLVPPPHLTGLGRSQ